MSVCRLCSHDDLVEFASLFHGDYLRCRHCDYIQQIQEQLPSIECEKEQYDLHENHLEHQGYVEFLSKFLAAIDVAGETTLDYGCGPQPVLSHLMREKGWRADFTDPIFYPNERISEQYDLVTCCEAVEHFHRPAVEFLNIREHVKMGGVLAIRTEMFSEDIEFEKWHYPRDPTHVGFFSKRTFEILAQAQSWQILKIDGPVSLLKRRDGI